LRDGTRKKIEYEIQQIDELLSSYAPLLSLIRTRTPDLTETSAVATVLHSFYGGIENIFGIVAKEIDQQIPSGANWHRNLLDQMGRPTETRARIVDEKDKEMLLEYLSFRHFFRHAYSFRLDWEQMSSLATGMSSNWARIKRALQNIHLVIMM
jgi:HepT-like protein